MSENQEFVEFCRHGLRHNEPIRLSPADSRKFRDMMENPPKPNPALVLALEKGRRIRENMQK
jgi:uncharacterized protein (DUF1778 family)